jgi:hypothetical protein
MTQVGVEAVGEGDVNDAVDAAESHRRLGPVAGKRVEALSGAACQKDPESIFHHFASDSARMRVALAGIVSFARQMRKENSRW